MIAEHKPKPIATKQAPKKLRKQNKTKNQNDNFDDLLNLDSIAETQNID